MTPALSGVPTKRDQIRSGYITPACLGADCLVRGGKNRHRWGMVKKRCPAHTRRDNTPPGLFCDGMGFQFKGSVQLLPSVSAMLRGIQHDHNPIWKKRSMTLLYCRLPTLPCWLQGRALICPYQRSTH